MSTDVIHVLVDIRDTEVHTQELVQTPHGLALSSRSPFTLLGTVRQVKVPGKKRGYVTVWRWESEGYSGDAGSKAKAVEAMLADVGYVQTTLTATIPDLLGDWGGAA